jgi:hypothetical protein
VVGGIRAKEDVRAVTGTGREGSEVGSWEEGVYEARIRCLYGTLSFDGWRWDGVASV